jgi:formiminoglutamase
VYPQNTFHQPLYRQPLSAQTIAQRLAAYHRPYHKQLAALIDHKVARFGRCVLLDLHSFAVFPSRPDEATPDIDLGNRRDTTSSAALRQAIGGTFQSSGLAVGNNACFTGGYITQHYGALAPVAAVQIELRYGAYIAHREFGEEVLTSYQSAVFDRAKMQLHQAFTEIIATVAGQA